MNIVRKNTKKVYFNCHFFFYLVKSLKRNKLKNILVHFSNWILKDHIKEICISFKIFLKILFILIF